MAHDPAVVDACRANAIEVLKKHGIANPEQCLDSPSRGKRGAVSCRIREHVGDRDGWICQICHRPVDPDHQWVPGFGRVLREQAVELVAIDPPVGTVLAWIDGDRPRAAAVRAALWAVYVQRVKVCGLSMHGACGHSRMFDDVHDAIGPLTLGWERRNHEHPSVEHLLPVCVGGTDDLDNLVLAHLGCNMKSADMRDRRKGTANQEIIRAVNAAHMAPAKERLEALRSAESCRE